MSIGFPNSRRARLVLSVACVSTFLPFAALAADVAKLKRLPPRVEMTWIDAVRNHETKDGSSVIQVLQYAQKMRPSEFRFEFYGVGYNGGTGEPQSVGIAYWIGNRRSEGGSYVNLFYNVEQTDDTIEVEMPVNPYASGTAVEALEDGRQTFLQFIDRAYKERCIDVETQANLC